MEFLTEELFPVSVCRCLLDGGRAGFFSELKIGCVEMWEPDFRF